MFRVIFASILISIAYSQCAFARKIDHPEPVTLKPYSLTLEADVDACKKAGCLPLIGITTETLVISDLEKRLPITLNFENCKMSFEAWNYKVKEEHILVLSGDNTPVEINCDGRKTTYPNAVFSRRNGEFGITLRKMKNGYSHLGKLSIGVMFLPVKD